MFYSINFNKLRINFNFFFLDAFLHIEISIKIIFYIYSKILKNIVTTISPKKIYLNKSYTF